MTSKPNNKVLWNKIKNKWLKSSKGGKPDQWSARKAQLASKEYKDKGGTWSKSSKQSSLRKWTAEKWGYHSSDKSKSGRYLPLNIWKKLTPNQILITNRNKRNGRSQYVPYESFIIDAFKKS